MNISKTSKTFCVVALNANPPILKYFQVTIIIKNYAEPPVFEVQVAISGVTPMGSGWANPRAPWLRGHPSLCITALSM